jgi:hypothetical protein
MKSGWFMQNFPEANPLTPENVNESTMKMVVKTNSR